MSSEDRRIDKEVIMKTIVCTSIFLMGIFVGVALFACSANAYTYDIQLNITSENYNTTWFNETSNLTKNITVFYTNYSLYPDELNLFQNTTKTIEINNMDIYNHSVSFDLIGMNAQIIWAGGYDLQNGSVSMPTSKYGSVAFNELGAGFFRINISGLNTTISNRSQPAIKVNITVPVILQRADFWLSVRECKNFTIVENASTRNVSVCVNRSTATWDDLNPDLQSEQLDKLSDALSAWFGALGNRTGSNATNLTSYKYYWEVTPEADDYLKELRDMKSCDTQVEKVRTEVIDFYTGEIKKKNQENGDLTNAKSQCDEEKKAALSSAEAYNLHAIKCEQTKRNETETAIDGIRRSEVMPAMFFSAALLIFVFGTAITLWYKRQRPTKMLEE